MAKQFQVFDTLRELGKSLDNFSRTVPNFGNKEEDEEQPTNKARAALQLQGMLAETKALKVSLTLILSLVVCELSEYLNFVN